MVSIVVEVGEAGLLHATSPQIPELLVTGTSMDELRLAVPEVVEALCSAQGQAVRVVAPEADGRQVSFPPLMLVSTELLAG